MTKKQPKRHRVRLDDDHDKKPVSLPSTNPILLTVTEAASYLRLSPVTLAKMRCSGSDGPPFYKLTAGKSGRVAYRISDLDDWLEKRKRQNTSMDDAFSVEGKRRG